MLRVPVHKIQPGMILARPVPLPSDPHRFLLQRDHEIPLDMVPRLKQLGVYEVWIRYRDLEFLEDLIDEELGDRQREVYHHVRRNFEQIMKGTTVEIDLMQFQNSIAGLFDYLKESKTGSVFLQKLDAFDNYLMSHSTNVCYLSLLLGMRLERYLIQERSFKSAKNAKDLQQLGLGCLLHDVGKMLIAPEILNKPGKLTSEEMNQIKMHPVYGFEMVKGQVSAAASQVVLNHHQRFNGEGYPARKDVATGGELPPLRGKQIPIFSRIATVARVRRRDERPLLLRGETARPSAARDADLVQGLFRSGRRTGVLSDDAPVPHRPARNAVQRRGSGGRRFQSAAPGSPQGAMPARRRRTSLFRAVAARDRPGDPPRFRGRRRRRS